MSEKISLDSSAATTENVYRNFPAYRFYSTTKRRNIQQIITFSSLNFFVSKNDIFHALSATEQLFL